MHRPAVVVLLATSLLAPRTTPQDAHDLAQAAAPPAGSTTRIGRLPGSERWNRWQGVLDVPGDTPVERAFACVQQLGAGFGVRPGTQFTAGAVHSAGDGTRVSLQQTVHGHALHGHGLWLRFDGQGRVVLVHGVVDPAAEATPLPRLDAEHAEAAALAALAATGLDPAAWRAAPRVLPVARAVDGGIQLVQRVELLPGRIPLAVELDALDGRVLGIVENTVHGGTFVFDGESHPFLTGFGSGSAYTSVKNALAAAESTTVLKQLAIEEVHPVAAPAGALVGRYCQVVDDSGDFVLSADLDFPFADDALGLVGGVMPEYQLFDHVNTYAWLSWQGAWFSKLLGGFEGDTSVVAFVNFGDGDEGYPNAFYSAADPDGEGDYPEGFFVFGEFSNVTGDVMDDFARDPSVVCHEYTHLVVDRAGHVFGQSDLDTPPRAVNEALADYAAAASLKNPGIGRVLALHGAELGLVGDTLRDLSEADTLEGDLFDTLGISTLLPEEHEAGEIFGAALWRARKALSPKRMDRLVFTTLDAWPQSTAETGHPSVDGENAAEAYGAYFGACFSALAAALDDGSPAGRRWAGRLLGAFMSHGLVGAPGTPGVPVHGFDATEGGLALSWQGEFLDSLDEHVVDITLGSGQVLALAMTGAKGTTVDFDLDDQPGVGDAPGELLATKPKLTNPAGTKVSQKSVIVNTARTYRLTLSNPDSEGGVYKFSLKVK